MNVTYVGRESSRRGTPPDRLASGRFDIVVGNYPHFGRNSGPTPEEEEARRKPWEIYLVSQFGARSQFVKISRSPPGGLHLDKLCASVISLINISWERRFLLLVEARLCPEPNYRSPGCSFVSITLSRCIRVGLGDTAVIRFRIICVLVEATSAESGIFS